MLPPINALLPYQGEWNKEKAMHLLTRCCMGPKRAEIKWCIDNGLDKTIDLLLEDKPTPDPPIYDNYDRDPNVSIGETWVNTRPTPGAGNNGARRRSHRVWWTGLIINSGLSILERMTLFWHEHLPVGLVTDGQYLYHYSSTLRKYALGNFKTLIEEITVAPAMLKYLNGNDNTRQAPNENYARELLELFTIGKGDLVAPGDYTHYTEVDVAEIARALTGWVAANRENDQEINSSFVLNRHDRDSKTLSHRFDNITIENEAEDEYKAIIDIILKKQEVARHLIRQLHIWLVSADITEEVEQSVIEPLSQILFDNNYEIKPVLRVLLASDYFNSGTHNGCMINSPIDIICKLINTFEINLGQDIFRSYASWDVLADIAINQNQELSSVSSVAGWKAYYQSPSFYQFWINSVSLVAREKFVNFLTGDERVNNFNRGINFLDFFASLENPFDVKEMIIEIASILFVFPLAENQIEYLQNIIIPGLPDYVWGEQYAEYLSRPDDEDLRTSITNKMKSLLSAMLKMPEIYLH